MTPLHNRTFSIRSCDCCGGSSVNQLPVSNGYVAVKCSECGLVQTEPVPVESELKNYYSDFGFLPPNGDEHSISLNLVKKSLLYHFGDKEAGSTFLDYGGGYGLYAKAASELGWQVTLFEYDQSAIRFAENTFGIKSHVTKIDQLRPASFDVIWAFHVIEHLRDVNVFVDDIKRLLRPGGIAVIATPNARSWEKYFRPKHFWRYWKIWKHDKRNGFPALFKLFQFDSYFCWDPPRHLYAFTPKSLEALGRKHNVATEIRIGDNYNPLYEPRCYVTGNSLEQISALKCALIKCPWRLGLLRALIFKSISLFAFQLGRFFSRNGGEQLYAIFRKDS